MNDIGLKGSSQKAVKRKRRFQNKTKGRHILKNMKMDLENNIFIVGAAETGKAYQFVKPNLMQMSGSYIITDLKGEIYKESAEFLQKQGYKIKVLNLLGNERIAASIHYDPFQYLRNENDVTELVHQMVRNVRTKGNIAADSFWEHVEIILLMALFFYVWREGYVMPDGSSKQNFPAVIELLKKAELKNDNQGNKMDSELDRMISRLEQENPNHPAVINYNRFISICNTIEMRNLVIISANKRMAAIEKKEILELLSKDEIDIKSIGKEKTVLYIIISNHDSPYKFIVRMLYSQIFNELYRPDCAYEEKFSLHVDFFLDEFASIIDNYQVILSNCNVIVHIGKNEEIIWKIIAKYMNVIAEKF